MNKIRLNLIVRTLLLPFIQSEFLSRNRDPIARLIEAYYQVSSRTGSSSINQKNGWNRSMQRQKHSWSNLYGRTGS